MPRVKSSYAKARRADALAGSKTKRTESFSRKVLSVVRKANPTEVKYHDMNSTIGTPNALTANTLNAILINGVAQGSGDDGRIGMRVNNKYLECRFSVAQQATATSALVRILVVQCQANAGTITAGDILQQVTPYASTDTIGKAYFKILRDELIDINVYNSHSPISRHLYIPLDGLKMEETHYSGTGSTIASINKGAIFLCFLSDVNIAASMTAGAERSGVDWYTRFAYTDN